VTRRTLQLREVERNLCIYRFLLTGEEPDAWVWQGVDPLDQRRVRQNRAAASPPDAMLLARIGRALSKVGTNAFGTCECCQAPIRAERLQLISWAERCAPCQRGLESGPSAKQLEPRVRVLHF
jgi:DnaK suppressor protein